MLLCGCRKNREMSTPPPKDSDGSNKGQSKTKGTKSGDHRSSHKDSSPNVGNVQDDNLNTVKNTKTEDQSPPKSPKGDSTCDDETQRSQSASHGHSSTVPPPNNDSEASKDTVKGSRSNTDDQSSPNSSKGGSTDETPRKRSDPHGRSSTVPPPDTDNSDASRDTAKGSSSNTENQSSPKHSKGGSTDDGTPRSRSDSHRHRFKVPSSDETNSDASRDTVKDSSSNRENQSSPNSSTGDSRQTDGTPYTHSEDRESIPTQDINNSSSESSKKFEEQVNEEIPMETDSFDYPTNNSKSEENSNTSNQNVDNNEAVNTEENRQTNEQDGKHQSREGTDQSSQHESASEAKEKDKIPSTASPNLSQVQSIEEFTSEDDFNRLSVSQMKNLLTKASVNFKGFIDRAEYVQRLQDVWKTNQIQLKNDGDSCKICCVNPINSVFLECGHMMACVDCAHKIKECPICRYYISRVIRVFPN